VSTDGHLYSDADLLTDTKSFPNQGLCSLFLVGGSPNTISSSMRLANYNRLCSNSPNGL